jgi:DNA-binding transcriptional regulator YdaS (Cro superfamily)
MDQEIHPLRRYRIAKGLSSVELAKLLGIAEPTARSLENGTRTVTAERAVEIEKATGGELNRRELRPDLFEAKAA